MFRCYCVNVLERIAHPDRIIERVKESHIETEKERLREREKERERERKRVRESQVFRIGARNLPLRGRPGT